LHCHLGLELLLLHLGLLLELSLLEGLLRSKLLLLETDSCTELRGLLSELGTKLAGLLSETCSELTGLLSQLLQAESRSERRLHHSSSQLRSRKRHLAHHVAHSDSRGFIDPLLHGEHFGRSAGTETLFCPCQGSRTLLSSGTGAHLLSSL
jgi:hypothetical protein